MGNKSFSALLHHTNVITRFGHYVNWFQLQGVIASVYFFLLNKEDTTWSLARLERSAKMCILTDKREWTKRVDDSVEKICLTSINKL